MSNLSSNLIGCLRVQIYLEHWKSGPILSHLILSCGKSIDYRQQPQRTSPPRICLEHQKSGPIPSYSTVLNHHKIYQIRAKLRMRLINSYSCFVRCSLSIGLLLYTISASVTARTDLRMTMQTVLLYPASCITWCAC